MSERYVGAWEQAGLFNPLNAPTPSYYTYNLYSWGYNGFGSLGNGNTTKYSSPIQVGTLTNWISIAAGAYQNAFGIKTDGTLWSWGYNSTGELGLGNTTNYSSPKQVGGLTTWSKVVAGNSHTVAIKTDGTLWTWGSGLYGGLGLGNTTSYSSPKQVGALTNWLIASATYACTLAIKTDGTLWSWGYNNFGQLGLGNTTNYNSPKQIGVLTNWASISSGASAAIATKTDGTLWSWGLNNGGQLAQGNRVNYSSPRQVGSLTNWTKNTGSYPQFGMGIKTDGTLWTWGRNTYGQLGLGNITSYSSPKQVGSLTNWLSIASGYGSNGAFVIKTDGTLWSWGQNNQGQLGLGNTTNYSSPTQVGSLTSWYAISASQFVLGLAY